MAAILSQKKTKMWRKCISSFVAFTFSLSLVSGANAQYITNLPKPGEMVLLSPAFQPAVLKGMTIHPENPLQFDFIVDRGQDNLSGEAFKAESEKLLKYFLAAMTIPDDDSWVNLSPYEQDRIVPDMLGTTDMGKVMLEQDYLLKQLSASLTNPQEEIGKKFWDTVYRKAYEKFGMTTVPINTFNKVWIIPDRAEILEDNGYAFIGETHLKVMLDEDYTSVKENLKNKKLGTDQITKDKVEELSTVSSDVVREIIIPELEKEINEGKNFAQVRQIYHSVILAAWYKQTLKDSLLGKIYVDKNKIKGVDIAEKDIKERVYEQYLAAFRKGVYNLIKEDYDLASKETLPRKYFSGGLVFGKAASSAIQMMSPSDPAAALLIRKVRNDMSINPAANDGGSKYRTLFVQFDEQQAIDELQKTARAYEQSRAQSVQDQSSSLDEQIQIMADDLAGKIAQSDSVRAKQVALGSFVAGLVAAERSITKQQLEDPAAVRALIEKASRSISQDLQTVYAAAFQKFGAESAGRQFIAIVGMTLVNLEYPKASNSSSAIVDPEKVVNEILPANLKILEAKGLPADSVDYWRWNFLELQRRENPEAFAVWSAANQGLLEGSFEAPIPVFTSGGNTTFDANFDGGITINGVKMKIPAAKFMLPEYRDVAKGVDLIIADANAGFGENLKRQKNLLALIKAGLIPDRPRDANDLPQLLAKSMDTFLPVRLSDGKTLLLSVFEQHLLRVIKFAHEGTYKSVSLQQLVNEQSIELVRKFLTNKFPAYAFELLGLSADKIQELQTKKVENYGQLFKELGVTILDPDEYPGLPTVNPETWEIEEGSTANAGHGLVAYRRLHQLLNQGKKSLADQRAGITENISNVVYAFTNGDGPNSWVPEELVGYMVQEGVGMALIGVPREMVDIKIGAPYRLEGRDSEGNPTDILGAAEIAEVKANPEALKTFLAAGRTPDTAGKQWANTNTLLINGKMGIFLAELAEIVGEDVLFKAMMPSLIHAKKGGVWRLEGAMITTVFNTFNFVNTSKDPKVIELKQKYGFDAEHPLLALPDLGRELRDDNFTPIKFIGDVIGMEVYLSTKAKFGSLDENLKVKFTRSPALVNFDSDGKFAERTGIASYGDLDEARRLIGNRGDWSKMDTFTVFGRVKMVNPTLVGNVHIENYGNEPFDMDTFIKTTNDMTAYAEVAPNGVSLTKDGRVKLENVMIIVSKSGRVFISPYNPGWAELTFEARKLFYDYLQKQYADKPIEINLTPAVAEVLLRQSGFNLSDARAANFIPEANREKKAKDLLSELGLTPQEKVVTVQGKKTVVAIYALLIAKGTEVVRANPSELQDYITAASSALLGEEDQGGSPSSSSSAVTGKKFLLVEDDDTNINYAQLVLEMIGGATVIAVKSGEEAMKLMDAEKFDGYILDNTLTGGGGTMRGLDVAKARLAAGDTTPTVFASTDFGVANSPESLELADLMAAYPSVVKGFMGKLNLDPGKLPEFEAKLASSGVSILVVDDSFTARYLSRAGYNVIPVANNAEIKQKLESSGVSPAAIIAPNVAYFDGLEGFSAKKILLASQEANGRFTEKEVKDLGVAGISIIVRDNNTFTQLVSSIENPVFANQQNIDNGVPAILQLGDLTRGEDRRFIVNVLGNEYFVDVEVPNAEKSKRTLDIAIQQDTDLENGVSPDYHTYKFEGGRFVKGDNLNVSFRGLFDIEVLENQVVLTPKVTGGVSVIYSEVNSDAVRQTASSAANVGGIDFDPSLLNLQIKRNGKGVPLPLPEQNIEGINIEGLYPVIINIQPATIQSFPFLLSAEKEDKVPELSMR